MNHERLAFRLFSTLLLCLAAQGRAPAPQSPARAEDAPRLVVQLGNVGGVGLVALSRDNRLALTADSSVSGQDHAVCLWEVATGREIRRFGGHTEKLSAVLFSPDGRLAASAGHDKTARVWDVETGAEVRRFEHGHWVLALAFSPDGRHLLSTTADLFDKASGHVWEVATGRSLRTLEGHTRNITAAAYSADGALMATGSWDATVRVWGAADGQLRRELRGPKATVLAVAFSPDGRTLAAACGDKSVRVYEVETGREVKKIQTPSSPSSVAFTPDGGRLLVGGDTLSDGKVRLWELATGREVRGFAGQGPASLSADGRYVLAPSAGQASGGSAALWATETGEPVRRLEGVAPSAFKAEVSPDGNYLLTVTAGGSCRLWDLRSGAVQPSRLVNSAAFTPDGKSLVTANGRSLVLTYPLPTNEGEGIQFWDVETGSVTRHIKAGAVGPFAVSPDGQYVFAGRGVVLGTDPDHAAHQLRVADGREERKFGDHTSTVSALALSGDGRLLLTAASYIGSELNDPPRLWDAKSGRELYRLASANARDVRGETVALSRDGGRAATAHFNTRNEAIILLWDTATGRETLTLKADTNARGFAARFNSLAFSPDGKLLAAASNDGTVRLWEVGGGREVKRFEGHAGGVNSVGFSADGRYLVSAGDDATTRFWSLGAGRELCRLISLNRASGEDPGHDRWVVVAPDGRFDTNRLNRVRGLHWLMPDSPLAPLPLEIFMRDYYEPQLLPRLLRCDAEKNCDAELKPLRALAGLNRALPSVRITKVTQTAERRVLSVTVEVEKGVRDGAGGGTVAARTTGVYDLRLFRDERLVGYTAAAEEGGGAGVLTPEEELREWRAATAIKLNPDGRQTFTFTVPLPKHKPAPDDIELSAYAYNEDRVKTETVRWPKAQRQAAPLAEAPPQRRAYVISVGVNASQEPRWRLKYAANDAREFQRVLAARLNQTSQTDVDESLFADEASRRYARQAFYYEVVAVPLIADDVPADGRTIEVRDATKAKIRAVFDLLAGRAVPEELRRALPNGAQLRRATPDDLVFVSFSCHGYADRGGNFYLLPYDVRAGEGELPDWRSAVSSAELSLWLRDVDAGDMALVIDACHAAAFTGAGFKPGPMGSRGLGQLAFDKGMLVLAASQASEAAVETGGSISQGLLSYALVRDGLEKNLADHRPRDNRLTLREWLGYAVNSVPRLKRDAPQTGQVKGLPSLEGFGLQQPSLFDFAPAGAEVLLSKQPAK